MSFATVIHVRHFKEINHLRFSISGSITILVRPNYRSAEFPKSCRHDLSLSHIVRLVAGLVLDNAKKVTKAGTSAKQPSAANALGMKLTEPAINKVGLHPSITPGHIPLCHLTPTAALSNM